MIGIVSIDPEMGRDLQFYMCAFHSLCAKYFGPANKDWSHGPLLSTKLHEHTPRAESQRFQLPRATCSFDPRQYSTYSMQFVASVSPLQWNRPGKFCVNSNITSNIHNDIGLSSDGRFCSELLKQESYRFCRCLIIFFRLMQQIGLVRDRFGISSFGRQAQLIDFKVFLPPQTGFSQPAASV